MAPVTSPSRSADAAKVEVGRGFRPDIEGMRALTLAIIILYHVKAPFVPGGFISVDVFFMLSGFLITGLVIREIRKTGTVGLAAFWGRRARRLLPAAGLVLLVTGIASLFILPTVEHRDAGIDIIAAALYVANMLFIRTSTDYFAATEIPSPVLHFWTLGVEEQFYLVWPLLLFAIAFVLYRVRARRGRERADALLIPVTLVIMGVVFLLSFILNVWLTNISEPVAFFLMPTRAWEFAAGALVGVSVVQLARIPQWIRSTMGWAGLAFLLWGVLFLQKTMPFPGWTAMIPVVATVLMLIAGTGGIGRGPGVLFRLRPMQAMGRMSYSWYLWHWPVLILGAVLLDIALTSANWWKLLPLPLLAFIPAFFAYRYVETPLRQATWVASSTRRSVLVGLAASLIGVLGGLLVWQVPMTRTINTDLPPGPTRPGALAPVPAPDGDLTPSLAAARADRPPSYGRCHLPVPETDSPECDFGDPNGSVRVALFGDSHAGQWISALDVIGQQQGWRVESYTKTGCPAPEVTPWLTSYKRPYTECDTWRQGVLASFSGPDGPDAVIATSIKPTTLVDASGAVVTGGPADALWAAGWTQLATAVTGTGATLIVVHDTPSLPRDPILCIDRNASDPSVCDQSRAAVVPPDSVDVDIVRGLPGVDVVDFNDGICYLDRCPVIRANRIVFRDGDHLTASYAEALAPGIAQILDPLVAEAVQRKQRAPAQS
jgi:peptidoglycan/LPS O-acetylase OafA/YrhL